MLQLYMHILLCLPIVIFCNNISNALYIMSGIERLRLQKTIIYKRRQFYPLNWQMLNSKPKRDFPFSFEELEKARGLHVLFLCDRGLNLHLHYLLLLE